MTNAHTMAVVTPKVKINELEEYSVTSLRTAISTCELVLHSPDYIYYLPYNKMSNIKEDIEGIMIRPLGKTI